MKTAIILAAAVWLGWMAAAMYMSYERQLPEPMIDGVYAASDRFCDVPRDRPPLLRIPQGKYDYHAGFKAQGDEA